MKTRPHPIRRLLPFLALLALVGTAWGLSKEIGSTERWTQVERRDLVIGVPIEGELQAVETVQLGPPQISEAWNFTISWMAPEGAEVRAGQPLLRFDTAELKRQLQQLRARSESAVKSLEKRETDLVVERRQLELNLAEAEARARRAALKLDIPEAVRAEKEITEAEIDQRLADIEIAALRSKLEHLAVRAEADLGALRKRRDRALARITELEKSIASMTVQAPRDGTLIYITDRRGEKQKVSSSVWRTKKVVEIPDLTRMRADAEVAEADAGRIAVGQAATLRLDAHPDRVYRGTVRSIRGTVQAKSWRDPKKIVRLEIELEETDIERMRPGMRLRGEIEIERLENRLVIPLDAVFPRPEGAEVVVKTLTGERRVHPDLGTRNSEVFEVLDGLRDGDRVLLEGAGGGT